MLVMTNPRGNKVVIFDLGNVVLDWDVDRILNSLSLKKKDLDLLRSELFFHQDWLDMDRGEETETSVVSRVCKRSSLKADTVESALFAAKNSLSPIAETVLLMREIANKGIEMFCLSNMSRETYSHIKTQEFFDMFEGIVISGLEKCIKPDEEIFHLAINRFELKPKNALFIDDSMPNIETAHRLGIQGFHFKRSQRCYARIRSLLFGKR